MNESCVTCKHKKEHCELGMWGEMFGWCKHYKRKVIEQ